MTVAVVVLALLLVGAGVFHVVQARDWSRERTRLTNAVMARHPGEFAVLQAQADRPTEHRQKSEHEKQVEMALANQIGIS